MTKSKPTMTREQKTFLILTFVFVVITTIFLGFGFFVKNTFLETHNTYYSNAYRPKVEQAEAMKQLQAEQRQQDEDEDAKDQNSHTSGQPSPLGFTEKDIYKAKGHRYKTW